MTKQKIFNMVATHLLTQNAKAESYYACMYRVPSGLKCAIGCLIPGDVYDPAYEGAVPKYDTSAPGFQLHDYLFYINDLLLGLGIISDTEDETIKFLKDLQAIHDCFVVSEWPKQLSLTAAKYKLSNRVVRNHVK